MLFTSLEFLFLFFPLTIGINFLLPKKFRNYWLLLTSLFFYAWGEPTFIIVMLGSILANYLFALRISEEKKHRRLILAIAIAFNLSLLFIFKYLGFTSSLLNSVFPSISVIKVMLPIGISFFTFQSISYIIDVYRGVPAQKNLFHLGLYISLFPQLVAGPIVRYGTVCEEIEERTITSDDFCQGMLRFVRGFNKKIIFSNMLAQVADFAFSGEELTVFLAWIGAICYALQIYFDFSGYSDMAIGIGRMLGFHFLENFNFPYISKTVTEFWRRWHISLSSWFKDYLYIPLGGSRVKSKWRLIFNLAVVWIATGIWHGASWSFLLWGMLYGALIIFEKLLSIPQKVEKHLGLRIPYQIFSLLVILFAWVLFRAPDLKFALTYFASMLGFASGGFIDAEGMRKFLNYSVFIVFGIICATPLFSFLRTKIQLKVKRGACVFDAIAYFAQIILFFVSVSYLIMDVHNPFIYFNF